MEYGERRPTRPALDGLVAPYFTSGGAREGEAWGKMADEAGLVVASSVSLNGEGGQRGRGREARTPFEEASCRPRPSPLMAKEANEAVSSSSDFGQYNISI